jgi:hypothetical protein
MSSAVKSFKERILKLDLLNKSLNSLNLPSLKVAITIFNIL